MRNHARYMRARLPTWAPAAIGAAAVATVATALQVRFVYDNATLRLVLETGIGLIALLVAFLLVGRYRRSGLMRDLLMVFALTLMGITSLFFSAVPSAVAGREAEHFSTWAPLICRGIAVVALAAAALSRGRAHLPFRALTGGTVAAGAAALTLAVVAVAVLSFHDVLPRIVESTRPLDAGRPRLEGHPTMMAIQLILVALFAIAAVGFYRQGRRDGDDLMLWFSAGAILAAVARLNFFLYPSLYTDFFYVGDVLRLGFYGMLLVGAWREISSYWEEMARLAVAEERRRVASALHDGLAQELALIATQSRWLMRRPPDDRSLSLLSEAAERALDESRRAIAALKRDPNEPLEVAVAQVAEEVASRVGARVRLDLESGPVVDPETREGLVRVVRDAVAEAGRGRGSKVIHIDLRRSDGVELRIVGSGTETADNRDSVVSLEAMSERARALGAEVRIDTPSEGGTEVEVVLR